MKKYIEPSIKLIYNTPIDSGYKLWLESRRSIISNETESSLQVGNELVDKSTYFDRVTKQGLQYNNIPFFVFEVQGSNLFRDLVFNFNETGQWSVSQRFVNSTFTEFNESNYPISSEYNNIELWENQFDKYMKAIIDNPVTDINRLEAPHSITCKFWTGLKLKELIALVSMMRNKMPLFYNIYGKLFIESMKSLGFNLEDYLTPYTDDIISRYFDHSNYNGNESSFESFGDMIQLKSPMGLLLLAQFLRQAGCTVKGLYNQLEHNDPDEFLNNKLFYANTPIPITYIADKNKFMRTIKNRTCWFSMSRGNNINSWSPVLDIVLKNLKSTDEFRDLLPCSFSSCKLTHCKYFDDVKFRNEGIEINNLPCSILSNDINIANKRAKDDKTLLSEYYVKVTQDQLNENPNYSYYEENK